MLRTAHVYAFASAAFNWIHISNSARTANRMNFVSENWEVHRRIMQSTSVRELTMTIVQCETYLLVNVRLHNSSQMTKQNRFRNISKTLNCLSEFIALSINSLAGDNRSKAIASQQNDKIDSFSCLFFYSIINSIASERNGLLADYCCCYLAYAFVAGLRNIFAMEKSGSIA